jgi:hypothetical protein
VSEKWKEKNNNNTLLHLVGDSQSQHWLEQEDVSLMLAIIWVDLSQPAFLHF